MASTFCQTSSVCKSGRAAINEAVWTFNYLKANEPAFNAASFQPAIESIQAQLAAVDGWFTDYIPFNPVCCTIEDLGLSASALSNQMKASVGAVNVPPPPPVTDWVTVALVGGVVLLLLIYSPQIKKAIA